MDIVDPSIEEYLLGLLDEPPRVEAEMRRLADERDGFPVVGPLVGRLLHQLASIARARRVFELGSGFGYSAYWFARALEAGSSVTLTDRSQDNLDRARDFLTKAGLVDRCRFEPAGDALEALGRAPPGIDLVFLDLDKSEYPRALAMALSKVRPGGLVVADNVLWGGAVARGDSDPQTAGLREFNRLIFGSEGLASSIVPVRDGVSITVKR